MIQALQGLMSSKKFVGMLISWIVAGLTIVGEKIGFNVLDIIPDLPQWILGGGMSFAIGQGIADAGKEKAKIAALVAEPDAK